MAYYFKKPTFTELTPSQRLALEEIEPIALTGGPGTGKTVVSLWRHIRNYELQLRKSLLLTYTKTLEYFLRQSASENQEAAMYINRTYWWTFHAGTQNYDEIIVDEAQDVESSKYTIVKSHSNNVCYGADDEQQVFKNQGCSLNSLRQLFPNNVDYELDKNFRNSREILEFTKAVFVEKNIPQEVIDNSVSTGLKPIAKILGFENFEQKVVVSIVEIANEFSEATHNIGILFPTAALVNEYYGLLSNSIKCSKFVAEDDNFGTLERIHFATFKSAKGLEFDTVIIPKFDSHKWFISKLDIISENDYYVGLTRTKRNLYLLCKENLGIFNNTYIKE